MPNCIVVLRRTAVTFAAWRPYAPLERRERNDPRMAKPEKVLVYRHAVVTRATHWINVLALTLLLMSGLNIFGAHPALYWGQKAVFAHPWFAIDSVLKGDTMLGVTHIGPWHFNTTGVLG